MEQQGLQIYSWVRVAGLVTQLKHALLPTLSEAEFLGSPCLNLDKDRAWPLARRESRARGEAWSLILLYLYQKAMFIILWFKEVLQPAIFIPLPSSYSEGEKRVFWRLWEIKYICLCQSIVLKKRYSSSGGMCMIQNALRFPQAVSFKWNKKNNKAVLTFKHNFSWN